MIFVSDVAGQIDPGQTGVTKFNKTKSNFNTSRKDMGQSERIERIDPCPLTPGSKIRLSTIPVSGGKFVAVSLITVLSIAALSTNLLVSPPLQLVDLEGPRIWILGKGVPESGEYTISRDEYAHLHAGWNSCGQYYPKINWSELSELEKNEFIETSTFELTIDGDPIELSCAQWLNSELDRYFVIYYIQFKPGDLAIGNHTFSGTWYSEVYGEPYSDDDYGTCPVTSGHTLVHSVVISMT
jgi:hypothetical protein